MSWTGRLQRSMGNFWIETTASCSFHHNFYQALSIFIKKKKACDVHITIYTTSQTKVAALTQFCPLISIGIMKKSGSKCVFLSRLLLSEYISSQTVYCLLANAHKYLTFRLFLCMVWLSSPNQSLISSYFPCRFLFTLNNLGPNYLGDMSVPTLRTTAAAINDCN